MKASCSMFSQLLKLIPRTEFESLVKQTKAQYACKGLVDLLGPRMTTAQDRDETFAAAHPLLRLANPVLTERIVATFAAASGPQLLGLRDAMAFAPLGATRANLHKLLAQDDPTRAVAAAAVLANHQHLDPSDPTFARLLLAEDAKVAQQAWRVLAWLDASTQRAPLGVPEGLYAAALRRPEPGLTSAVLGAALGAAVPWAWPELRRRAQEGEPGALAWLASVASAGDVPLLHAAMTLRPALEQAGLLGRSGHPHGLPLLADWMQSENPHLAGAAGEAFTRIIGEDVRGLRVTPPPREDADEFEREMAPAVWLPDHVKVAAHLDRHGAELTRCERWNRGLPMPADMPAANLAQVDLPARWDACVRAVLAGRPIAQPP